MVALGQLRLFVSSLVSPYLKISQLKCSFISDFAGCMVFGLVFSFKYTVTNAVMIPDLGFASQEYNQTPIIYFRLTAKQMKYSVNLLKLTLTNCLWN